MPTVANIEQWMDQVAPMAWRDGRIYYHKTGKGVVAEGYSCQPDRSDETPETDSALYPNVTQQSIEDVSADGRYALGTVERSNHWGNPDGYPGAAPGAGVYNDLWILDLQTKETWKLVDLVKTGTHALIWPRFSEDGKRICWAELWSPDYSFFTLGKWRLCVASIVWTDGVPTLGNKRILATNAFVEPYGFLEDGSVLATTSALGGVSYWNPQIVKYPVSPTNIGGPTRLSPKTPDEAAWWAPFQNYCEFAYEMPAFPDRIMFGRMFQADQGSIEFWTMKKDGSDVRRLTYFSKHGHPQFQGSTCILGGIGWDPDNPYRFVAGYATEPGNPNNNFKSVMVTLA